LPLRAKPVGAGLLPDQEAMNPMSVDAPEASEPFQAAFNHSEIGEDDLVFHRPDVTRGIDGSCRVRD